MEILIVLGLFLLACILFRKRSNKPKVEKKIEPVIQDTPIVVERKVVNTQAKEEALMALHSLGYKKKEAADAINKAIDGAGSDATTQEIIKSSFTFLNIKN